MESAARAFEAAGDLRNAHAQRLNTMAAQLEVGAYEEVARAMREAVPSAERMGLVSYAALGRCNLGMALRALGALDEARAVETEATRAFAAQGDRAWKAPPATTSPSSSPPPATSKAPAREAREGRRDPVQERPRPRLRPGHPGPRRAHPRRGPAAPLTAAREAMLASLGGIEEGESAVLLVHAEAPRRRRRDRRRLRRHRRGAGAASGAGEADHGSGAEGRGFWGRVAENARTLELARAWVGEG